MSIDALEVTVWKGQEHITTEVLEPGSYTVGRTRQCGVTLPAPEVSRQHAHLEFYDGAWRLDDLGSKAAFAVNGRQMRHALLDERTNVVIGPFTLSFQIGDKTELVTRMATSADPHHAQIVLLTNHPQIRVPVVARVSRIGRSTKAQLQLDDPHVSRTHALVRRIQGEYHLEDVGSANGTWVNDARVHSTRLQHGDQIRIGGQLVLFELT